MNKRTGDTKEKGALTIYMRKELPHSRLEQLPADGAWIFNDPNQDAVITKGTDCHTGALCAEHPGICRLVLFMVPVLQVWHWIGFRSQGGEVTGPQPVVVLFRRKCVRIEASRFYVGVCCNLAGTMRRRDLRGLESGVKGWDSLQFIGKLTSSQHQCEDIILLSSGHEGS